MKRILAVALFAAVAGSLALTGPARLQPAPPFAAPGPPNWKAYAARRIAEFGHRNWILVADSAYPAQSRGGVETVLTGADHLDVTEFVLDEIARQKHVRPVLYTDAELPFVGAKDAPGIEAYRGDLKKLLGERKPSPVPHEELIAKLDKAGGSFQVLVLKTTLALPYTSVFIELDCGYWSAEAEQRMRDAMKPKER